MKAKKARPLTKDGSLQEVPEEREALPPLDGCVLELDWRDFKGLLEEHAQRSDPDPDVAPPRAWILGGVEAKGEVRPDAGSARIEAEAELEVLTEEWAYIPLVSGEVALWEVTWGEAPTALAERDGTRGLLLQGPAQGRLRFRFEAQLLVEATQSALTFGLPAAPSLELDLLVPGEEELDLLVKPAVRREVRREGRASRVSASSPEPRQVRVSWTVAAPDLGEEPKAEPVIRAEVDTLARVGEGSLSVRAVVRAEVLRAAVRDLTLTVPAGNTITDVRAPSLAQWEASPEGGAQRVRLLLEEGALGPLRVEVDCDRQLSEDGKAPVPVVRLQGAVRAQGHVAIAPLTNVDVACAQVQGLRRVDPRELPADLSRRTQRPVVHAFHYAGTEPGLTLEVTKHPDLPVITTMADRAEYLVMVTEDGKRFAQVRWRVRNSQRQFLRVEMTAEEQLLSALRDGEPVKPAADGPRHILVPLRRARSPEEAEAPFTVEVVTLLGGTALSERGQLSLSLPGVDLPVGYLTCELHLPQGYVYDDFTGALEEVDAFSDPVVDRGTFVGRCGPPPPPLRPVPARAPAPRMQAAAQMIQMEMPEPSPEPLSEAMAEEAGDALDWLADAGEQVVQAPPPRRRPAALARPSDGGRLPIRIDIPEQGQRFRFERVLCLGEEIAFGTEYTRERRS